MNTSTLVIITTVIMSIILIITSACITNYQQRLIEHIRSTHHMSYYYTRPGVHPNRWRFDSANTNKFNRSGPTTRLNNKELQQALENKVAENVDMTTRNSTELKDTIAVSDLRVRNQSKQFNNDLQDFIKNG